MSLMYDLLKAGGCSIVAFGGCLSPLSTKPRIETKTGRRADRPDRNV